MGSVETPKAPNQSCQFWLPMKKRCCGWKCKEGEQYCGNHLYAVTGAGEQRVPCPANPNHDVPISQLKAHLKRCPEAIRKAAAKAQPYFLENLNTGADLPLQQQQDSADGAVAQAAAAAVAAEACASFLKGTAEHRTATAIALGPDWFMNLVNKIDTAHASLTATYPLARQLLGGCDGDLEQLFQFSRDLDPLMPFDRKHAAQHASIVGNMQSAGLLSSPQDSIFVELGAGKGFLTAWLHQVCGANELILLDRQGNFIKKADRRLRHTRLTRVAVDLKDAALLPLMHLHLRGLSPAEVKQQAHQQRLERIHKHCQKVHQQHVHQQQQQQQVEGQQQQHEQQDTQQKQSSEGKQQQQQQQQQGIQQEQSTENEVLSQQQQQQQQQCQAAEHSCQSPATQSHDSQTSSKPANPQNSNSANGNTSSSSKTRLKNTSFGGLICCPYEPRPGLEPSSSQGTQQQQQQQQMPWVAHGKHLCGAATDFALRACYNAVLQAQRMADHRCSSSSSSQKIANTYAPSQPGSIQHEQDTAVPDGCGVDARGKDSSSTPLHCSSSSSNCQYDFKLQGLAIATCCHHRCGWTAYCGREVLQQFGIGQTEFETISWLTSWALCGHEAAPGTSEAAADQNNSTQRTPAPQQQQQQQQLLGAEGITHHHDQVDSLGHCSNVSKRQGAEGYAAAGSAALSAHGEQQQQQQQLENHPAGLLDRASRIALGLKCKQLLDAGRCAWISGTLLPVINQQQQAVKQQRQGGSDEEAKSSCYDRTSSTTCSVKRVCYIDQSVTGENTLLLVA